MVGNLLRNSWRSSRSTSSRRQTTLESRSSAWRMPLTAITTLKRKIRSLLRALRSPWIMWRAPRLQGTIKCWRQITIWRIIMDLRRCWILITLSRPQSSWIWIPQMIKPINPDLPRHEDFQRLGKVNSTLVLTKKLRASPNSNLEDAKKKKLQTSKCRHYTSTTRSMKA